MDPMPAVLGVLGVLATALWWLRKKGSLRLLRPRMRGATRRLESMERLALSPNHALYLVRVDDRALLIAQSPSGLILVERAGSDPGRPAAEMRAMAAERA